MIDFEKWWDGHIERGQKVGSTHIPKNCARHAWDARGEHDDLPSPCGVAGHEMRHLVECGHCGGTGEECHSSTHYESCCECKGRGGYCSLCHAREDALREAGKLICSGCARELPLSEYPKGLHHGKQGDYCAAAPIHRLLAKK
jgi:hypothetical protein